MGLVSFFQNNWRSVAWSAGILLAAIGVALIVRAIAFTLLKRLTRRRGALLGESLVRRGQRPSHWILPFLAVLVVIPGLPLPAAVNTALSTLRAWG